MESNLPEVSNVNRALAINATASQSALTTKSKLKHVPKQQLRPSPVPEAPSFSVDNSGKRRSMRTKKIVAYYPK
jgi:hypothetical protein